MMTVKDLRDFLNSHNLPDNAELVFEDGNETGVEIAEITREKIGAVDCVVFRNKGIAFDS